jgi:signal peptidase I
MNARENVSKALVEEVVRSTGEVRLRVLGTSMAPAMLPGDLVSIRRAGLDKISLGEVVLFAQNGRLFVHRVVGRNEVSAAGNPEKPCLITRGDRLRHDDPPVSSRGSYARTGIPSENLKSRKASSQHLQLVQIQALASGADNNRFLEISIAK